ncbi:MAG: tRNA lysidine(34) synthetase TilS [Aquiluna sp.]|nr:tRNA lysidine(34) synthetase TilS [Aquiluna sp.]MCF8545566.1 tRNA lysidine(34) synthetase TilS [Aquiluna sp.]
MQKRPRLIPEVAHARTKLTQALENAGVAAGDRVVLAVSGGSDSLALALAMSFVGPKLGIESQVVVVDHDLQAGSGEIALAAVAACKEMGLTDSRVVRVKVAQNGEGLEAAARTARYKVLEEARQSISAKAIILAHTKDDQAESVMLGLVRGSGLASIAGMAPWDPDRHLLRPFLGLTKAELRSALTANEISYWEDPHNQDPKFKRVAVRQALIQLEESLGPGIAQALSQTADIAREAQDYIASQAAQLLFEIRVSEGQYQLEKLESAHAALRNKTLHLMCQEFGARSLSFDLVEMVAGLVTNWHGQKPIALSGITVERVKDLLVLSRQSK